MSKGLQRKVRRATDYASMADILERDSDSFEQFATRYTLPGKDRFYMYKDNGSPILGVAHLDSVQSNRVANVTESADGPVVFSGSLDDRLGAWVLLDLLPRLGIVTDVLLTTDEEIGQSTASAFVTDKPYHWLYSFDRGGDDVVMYEYETAEYAEMVEDCGLTVGRGSFSDICSLEHLGVMGANWGVGYRDYHSARSHAFLRDTWRTVAAFVRFYAEHASTRLPHVERTYAPPSKAVYLGAFGSSRSFATGTRRGSLSRAVTEADDWARWYAQSRDHCPVCREDLVGGWCSQCGLDVGAEEVSADR